MSETATVDSQQRRIDPEAIAHVFRTQPHGPGRLVSIVGFDGSGKTTQIEAVAEGLRALGTEVIETRQPTDWYRELAEVKTFHDQGGSSDTAHILALLAAADRRRHVMEVVDPALARGAVVLCDRYVYATYGVFIHRGVSAEFLTTINAGIPRPDFAFYLRLSPDELLERLRIRDGDDLKFEEKSRSRIHSITRTYEELGDELISVDASAAASDITASILSRIGGGR